VRSIAVLRPSALGDFFFALPALHALRAAYPEACITYLGKPWHVGFLKGRPGPISEVIALPPVPGVGETEDAERSPDSLEYFFTAMRARRFDLAIQLFGGGRFSNPFVKRFGARCSVGMRDRNADALDRNLPYVYLQNERLRLLETVGLVGAKPVMLDPSLAVAAADRSEAAPCLAEVRGELVVLQPGARDPRRRWPPHCFAQVADRLAGLGFEIAIVGTEDEKPLAAQVRGAMREPVHDFTGRLSPAGLCGLFERIRLFVTNDTGPMHVAHAVGAPVVGIYWLTNFFISAPLSQARHRAALSWQRHCPECGADNMDQRCPHDCCFVADVRVEEVLELALELLREGGVGKPDYAPGSAALPID
jgi:ADP-heptose:LPS heptosyltransferase